MKEALSALRTLPWPFKGRIGIRETAADGETAEMHVIDRWCHLGAVRSEQELYALAEGKSAPPFDVDIYKIIKRFLAKPPRKAAIIELAA